MTLTCQEILDADLSSLNSAGTSWKSMSDKFGQLRTDYDSHVRKALDSGTWKGISAISSGDASKITRHELAAAKAEALAVSEILKKAYTGLRKLQESLKTTVSEAKEKGFHVNTGTGQVTVDWNAKVWTAMSPEELRGVQNNLAGVAAAEAKWTETVKKQVEQVNDADNDIRFTLKSVLADGDGKGLTGGFNGRAEGDMQQAPAPKGSPTSANGWKADGKVTATGPDLGFSVTGPGYGKEGMLKAYADVGRWTGEGSLTNGPIKLSGIADVYGGARATAIAGITDAGLLAEAEASAGVRALTEGRVGTKHATAYGRASGFAGGEVGGNAGLGTEGFTAKGKAFAGAKGAVAGGAELGGIGVGVTAEGWAGPGAEGELTLGKGDDGKYHFGGKVGVSPVLGGAVGMEFTVDPGKVSSAANDAADALGDVAGGIGSAAGSVKDGLSSVF